MLHILPLLKLHRLADNHSNTREWKYNPMNPACFHFQNHLGLKIAANKTPIPRLTQHSHPDLNRNYANLKYPFLPLDVLWHIPADQKRLAEIIATKLLQS